MGQVVVGIEQNCEQNIEMQQTMTFPSHADRHFNQQVSREDGDLQSRELFLI